jgi:hypothetical protein
VTHGNTTTVLTAPTTSTVYITSTTVVCTKCEAGTPPPATLTPPAAAAQPYTTITVETSVSVPCTYTEGSSIGLPIPSSFTIVPLSTTVTVPAVQFTTVVPGTTGGSQSGVALVPPPATPAPATGTAPVVPGVGTTFSVNTAAGVTAPPPVQQYTGGAPRATGAAVAGLAFIAGAVFVI